MKMRKSKRNKKSIFIIGCGGTGSWFIRQICCEAEKFGNFRFYLFDHDIVEHKNLERQDFKEEDIRKHKAVVLARRLWEKGLDVYPVINTDIRIDLAPSIVILAVDNMKARRKYYELIYKNEKLRPDFWFDAGNGEIDGQIFALTKGVSNRIYEHFLYNTEDRGPNCAENERQSIFINKLMGKALLEFLKRGLEQKDVPQFYHFNPERGDNIPGEEYTFYELLLLEGHLLMEEEKEFFARNVRKFGSSFYFPTIRFLKREKEIFLFYNFTSIDPFMTYMLSSRQVKKLLLKHQAVYEIPLQGILLYKASLTEYYFVDFKANVIKRNSKNKGVKKLIKTKVLKKTSVTEHLSFLRKHSLFPIKRLNVGLPSLIEEYVGCSNWWSRELLLR